MRASILTTAVAAAFFACGGGSSDQPGDGTSTGDSGVAQDGSSGSDGGNGGSDSAAGDAAGGEDASEPACPGAKPDATNTGVPAGTTLTTVTGDVNVTTDGTVIDAQDIHGYVTITASHVTVKRSIVRGSDTTTGATRGIIQVNSGTDITIEDVEVVSAAPSVDIDGIWGSNFVVRRANVHSVTDGIKIDIGSMVECNYVHDLIPYSEDPELGGAIARNDAIQILKGQDITIVGNNLVPLLPAQAQNAAIEITEGLGLVTNVHIEHNWADAGGCTFNISHMGSGHASMTDIHTLDNRFGRSSFFANCPILKSNETTLDSQGDVWDDDGTPVPIQSHD